MNGKSAPRKRWMEMVFDTKWHVGDWPGAHTFDKKDGCVRQQVKNIAQQAAWDACQNDGFLLVQRRDGIVTIIAGPDAGEIE